MNKWAIDEGKVDKKDGSPEKNFFISMKKSDLSRIARKYLVIIPDINIIEFRICRIMMGNIMFFYPPRIRKSDEQVRR